MRACPRFIHVGAVATREVVQMVRPSPQTDKKTKEAKRKQIFPGNMKRVASLSLDGAELVVTRCHLNVSAVYDFGSTNDNSLGGMGSRGVSVLGKRNAGMKRELDGFGLDTLWPPSSSEHSQ